MIEYRKATEADLPAIVDVHVQCFQGYFLTSLGKPLLLEFYKSFFYENNLFVVAYDNEKMIGFYMGHLNPSEARRNFEKKNSVRLFFKILLLCLKGDKNAIERVTARLFKKKSDKTRLTFSRKVDATCLSAGVLPEYRRNNVATQLQKDFETLLKQHNAKNYAGSVRPENIKIQKFFEKLGFEVIEKGTNGIRYMGNLED